MPFDNAETMLGKKKKKKAKADAAMSGSPDIVDKAEDLETSRIMKLKKHLKLHLKSREDLSKFEKRLNGKKLKIGDEVIVLSKVGKRKIMKKVESLTSGSGSEPDDDVEKVLLRKLKNCLGRLLVKYDKGLQSDKLKTKVQEKITTTQAATQSVERDSHIAADVETSIAQKKLKQKKKKRKIAEISEENMDITSRQKKSKKHDAQKMRALKPVKVNKTSQKCNDAVNLKKKKRKRKKKMKN